jgi:hypothetical protein
MSKGIDNELLEGKFDMKDVEDVRILIRVNGKHYGIVANKEREASEKLDAAMLRKLILPYLLKVHDIILPSLEECTKESLEAELNRSIE